MPNAVAAVKKAAVEAVDATKPTHIVFGRVIATSPLKIQVDQKSIYTEKMLILTRNVTNYTLLMTVNHTTGYQSGGSGETAFEDHAHSYSGTKAFQVNNALAVGERVALVRIQGGRKFLVLDRVAG